MSNAFRFKQFVIRQEQTPMKVGTDGVLLGAWATVEKAGHILDIGTGTGLLALMAAQRNPQAWIDAIEIDENACLQAALNISASPWKERIQLFSVSVFHFHPSKKYDSILCNPPFFIRSTPPPDSGRTLARHCENFDHTALALTVKNWLSQQGRFSLVLPVREAEHLINPCRESGLYLSRLTRVLPNPGKPPKRYLMEFSLSPATTVTDELIVELSRHLYSEAYRSLTRDFYLNF